MRLSNIEHMLKEYLRNKKCCFRYVVFYYLFKYYLWDFLGILVVKYNIITVMGEPCTEYAVQMMLFLSVHVIYISFLFQFTDHKQSNKRGQRFNRRWKSGETGLCNK